MSDYPKMLFKKGGAEEIWGLDCTTRIVDDATAEADARAKGYCSSPNVAHGKSDEPEPTPGQASELDGVRGDLAAAEAMIADQQTEIEAKDAEIADLKAQLAAFDHDGDGKAGGSKPKLSAKP